MFASWWKESTDRVSGLDRDGTTELLEQALERFHEALLLQHLAVLGVIQPSLAMLDLVARRSAVPEVTELGTTSGNAEMDVVCDLWQASRGHIGLDQVVANHGFHAPLEGELSTRVWREDDLALRRMVEQYSRLDDADDPLHGDAAREADHEAITSRAVAAFPWWQRRPVRGVIALARRNMPLRGVAKCSYLQGFDVIRACARRLGVLLAADGAIEHPDDVFYLTMPELTGGLPADARAVISGRRARRAEYQQVTIPGDWQGMPAAQPVQQGNDGPDVDRVTGIGVSPGVVEGQVRVVLEPDFTEIEPGEILVAPTTDPSWSSIMFISAGLVVDIGGLLSHAAVVAREMGVPCVANTRTGTRSLRTGDRVRVDGASGIVVVLERARPGS
jgi:pyruvate,water dikinase